MIRLYLVDGTYELFRAYYGSPPKRNAHGLEVGATLGFTASLLALIRDHQVSHVACAFDHVIESFRNEMFAGYKTGEGVEPELLAQFELAEQAALATGCTIWPMIHYETDDALATAAFRWKTDPRVEQIVLCSPDKDFAQCVDGNRVVCLNRRTGDISNEEKVLSRFGIRPTAIPDWLALVGDSADGIPGIPGWGKKTASTVLATHGSLEKILEDDSWQARVRGGRKLAAGLREEADAAFLYRDLATLRTHVELEEDLEDLAWQGVPREPFEDLSRCLGDASLVDRVFRWK